MSKSVRDMIDDCYREEQADMVNHPAHYQRGGVECIDAIKAAMQDLNGIEGYYTGNAIKYLFRWKAKNGVEDVQKAAWYVRELIEYIKANETRGNA